MVLLGKKMETFTDRGNRPFQVVRELENKPNAGLNDHQLEVMRDTYRCNGVRIFEQMESQRSTRINR